MRGENPIVVLAQIMSQWKGEAERLSAENEQLRRILESIQITTRDLFEAKATMKEYDSAYYSYLGLYRMTRRSS